jgi:GDP-D-mannose dehydratase
MTETKILHASTSEMFGQAIFIGDKILNENSEFKPVSPYAVSKVSASYMA